MKITPLERGVRFERWIPSSKPPAFIGAVDGLIDGYIGYDYIIPGVLLMWSGNFTEGTAQSVKFGRPDFDQAIGNVSWTSQAVTSLTEKTARYFYSTGPLRRFGNEQVRDIMVGVTNHAFAEDKTMIEGQQRIIDRTSNPQMMPTSHDRGSTIFNRLVDRLVKEEGAARQAAA